MFIRHIEYKFKEGSQLQTFNIVQDFSEFVLE